MKKFLIFLPIFIIFLTFTFALYLKLNSTDNKTSDKTDSEVPSLDEDKPDFDTIEFSAESSGCKNIFVYKTNLENTTGISVFAHKELLELNQENKVFELGSTENLTVEILEGEGVSSNYCNDVVNTGFPEPEKYTANKGKVIINVTEIDESQPIWNRYYDANVTIQDVYFVDEKGDLTDIYIKELKFESVQVGLLPG